jgi:hypothetical protein
MPTIEYPASGEMLAVSKSGRVSPRDITMRNSSGSELSLPPKWPRLA